MSTTSLTEQIVFVESDGKKTRKSHNKPARIATRTKWSLQAILDEAESGRVDLAAMRQWLGCERLHAKGQYDQARLLRLGEFERLISGFALRQAAIERLAADARIGEYRGPVSAGD